MLPLLRSWILEILAAGFALLVVAAGAIALVDGVEQARIVAGGERLIPWLSGLVPRIADRTLSVVPILAALAAGGVASRWARSGWLDGIAACGVRPSRLAAGAGLAGCLLGTSGVVVREIVAPAPGAVSWVAADGVSFSADEVSSGRALGVRAARVARGRLVGASSAVSMRRAGDRWSAEGVRSWGIFADPEGAPAPAIWRSAGTPPGPEARLRDLVRMPASPARSAWLGDRAATVVGSGLLAATAVPLSRRRYGLGYVLIVAALGRLAQGGLAGLHARGGTIEEFSPLLLGGIVAFAIVGVVVGAADRRGASAW